MSDLPPIDSNELDSRLERAQRSMREFGLDALLLTTPPNFQYFSGFDTQFWESPTRPWYLIAPAIGKCTLVIPEIGVPAFAGGWIEDIRHWPAPRPADDGITLLAQTLTSLPSTFGSIGLELGRESTLRMPLIDLDRLRGGVSKFELVDGSPCIWNIRKIKSNAEVARIQRCCEIVSDAFENLPSLVMSVRNEAEICRSLTIDILSRGADSVPFMAAASGPGGYAQIISRPRGREIGDGDVLIIDVGAKVDGYFCDFDRNFGFGHLGKDVISAQDAVWRATEAGIAAARPGAAASDLWRAMNEVLEGAGLRGSNVGRLGHGLGMQLTEPPSNMPGDATVLEAGMVMTIEPGMEYARGRMIVHEENILITDEGAELLTRRAPRRMPLIP